MSGAVAHALNSWESLIRPHKIHFERINDVSHRETMVVEPLEKGFGITLGNALRRVLLSSIQGTAVTAVDVEGAFLEFASLPGVVEDMTDIILNLKVLKLRLLSAEDSKDFTVQAQGPCVVTAGMIEKNAALDVIDPDQVICTLTQEGAVSMTLTVSRGKGYVPAPQNTFQVKKIGQIMIDARFSPIDNVAFEVKDARVGQSTDFDSLAMTVQTNGTITPRDALHEAAMILHDQLRCFLKNDAIPMVNLGSSLPREVEGEGGNGNSTLPPVLFNLVKDLPLPVRCLNCLKSAQIVYVGDLVKKTKDELLRTPSFGKKSLDDIEALLGVFHLSLGMSFPDWPPHNIQQYPEES